MSERDHRQEFTVREAAELVGISALNLRRWIEKGRLPARRAGEGERGTLLIARADLLAFRRWHQRNPFVRAGRRPKTRPRA